MNGTWNLNNPYVYQALSDFRNRHIVVQTIRGSVRGLLQQVTPDHIVVNMGGTPFYIRTENIIWFNPLKTEYE